MGRWWLPGAKAGIEGTLSSPPDGKRVGGRARRVAESPGRGRKRSALPLFLEIERLLWPGLVSGPEMHPVTSGKCKEPQCPASTETPRSPGGTQDYSRTDL